MKKYSAKVVVEEGGVSYFAWSIITDGFFDLPYYRLFIGKPLTLEIMLLQSGHGRWAVSIENLKELSSSSLLKLEKGTYAINEMKKLHLRYGHSVIKSSNQLKKYLTHKNKSVLVKDILSNWNNFLHLNCLGTVLVWADMDNNPFTEKLKFILLSKNIPEEKVQEYLSLLISQDKPSAQWKELYELFKIAVKYKKVARVLNSKEFKRHCDNYRWIQYGYHGPEQKVGYFSTRLKKIIKSDLMIEYRKHSKEYTEIKKSQRRLEKSLSLNKFEKHLFRMARDIMYLKSYRVDVRYYFHLVMDSIFRNLAKEFKVPYKWFHYAERDDIIKLIQGKKVNIGYGIKRENFLLRVKDGKTIKFFNKQEGKRFLNSVLISEKISETSVIKGTVAHIGKVVGVVRIINSTKDIPKVKKGDILVAMATNPDLLPAMVRAAAFVTNSGGITSHAAIVAREMKKPCVIGTKIATKVFRDGDLVEVDANRGIVSKL